MNIHSGFHGEQRSLARRSRPWRGIAEGEAGCEIPHTREFVPPLFLLFGLKIYSFNDFLLANEIIFKPKLDFGLKI